MSDFKWEMQERVDAGMSPDEAYSATRDSYAAAYDNRDKFSERRPGVFDLRKQLGRAPTAQEYRDAGAFACNPDESGGLRDDDASAGGA